MSLRARLSLIIGTIVALGAVGGVVVAYRVTQHQLYSEVDRTLFGRGSRRSFELAGLGENRPTSQPVPVTGNQLPGPRVLRNFNGDDPQGGALIVVQRISTTGKIVSTGPVEIELPVSNEDRVLAKAGTAISSTAAFDGSNPVPMNRSKVRSVEVQGRSYRLATVSLPGGGALQVARNVDEQQRVLSKLRLRFGVGIIVLTLLGALAGWEVARRLTRPLRRLASSAGHIAATKDLDHDVDADAPAAGRRRDEIGQLAGSFQEMVGSLRESRDQQRRLVQDAGHELRTPLTSIRANVELLRRAPQMADEDRHAAFDDTLSELDELSSLTDSLVDLAAGSDSGDEPMQALSLAEPVERAVDRARRRNEHDIELIVSEPLVRPLQVQGIERAVSNLVDNAAKFSPPGTRITVRVEGGTVTVADQGPGVDEAERPFIFERFYRATAARSKPGSGLGLSIVSSVVERHGGTTSVDATPGGGALIGFTLPA